MKKHFCLVRELNGSSVESGVIAGPETVAAFKMITLKEAVHKVQSFLSNPTGSDEEKAKHNQLLHQAVIGNPKAQEKIKSTISQWLLEQRIRLQHVIPGMGEVDSLFAEAQGLSVIEDLYKSRIYEEIEVVGTKVFCMVKGKKFELPHRRFNDPQHVMDIQQRLVLYGHARISEREPYCHSFLYDGSRLTMKMPPFSAEPTITIRRFIVEDVSLAGMEKLGTINGWVAQLLTLLVKGKVNGIIAGDTGTGKTTLLHSLIEAIPAEERIVTLESEFELRVNERFPKRNVIALQELYDIGITMTRAFPTILRETPDRIIIGEVRSVEVVDALKACSRGHRGSWFTLHLSDPKHLRLVLYTLYLESGLSIPLPAFEMQLGLAIDVLIFMKYLKNGTRVVEGIYSIFLNDQEQLQVEPVVIYHLGEWTYTGNKLPRSLSHLSQSFSDLGISVS